MKHGAVSFWMSVVQLLGHRSRSPAKRQECPQTDVKGQHPLRHHYVLDANEPWCHESSTVSLPRVGCELFDAVTLLSGGWGTEPGNTARAHLGDAWHGDTSVLALMCTHHLVLIPSTEVYMEYQSGQDMVRCYRYFLLIYGTVGALHGTGGLHLTCSLT